MYSGDNNRVLPRMAAGFGEPFNDTGHGTERKNCNNGKIISFAQSLSMPISVGVPDAALRAKRNNPYHFFRTNQRKGNHKIYFLTQCDLTVNGCD